MGQVLSAHPLAVLSLVAATAILPGVQAADAQDHTPVRIALVTFLSGPAAETFGVPAKIAAEAIAESLNAGKVPPPYGTRGFGGSRLELVIVDEEGGPTKQVSEFRNLVARQDVDFVIGYLSSSDCLAIAPLAEELKKLTVLFDCGTPRIFEERRYKYVFRTHPHMAMDAVGAARYLLELRPTAKRYSGINPDTPGGQESWSNFDLVMKTLDPGAQVGTSQLTALGAVHYETQISALTQSGAEVVHSSLSAGDLEAFVTQAAAHGLLEKTQLVLVAGEPSVHRLSGTIPDGTIVGARGTHGIFAPEGTLKSWLQDIYKTKTGEDASAPAYSVALAFLGLKAAYERAKLARLQKAIPMGANKGVKEEMEKAYAAGPSQEDVIAAFEGLVFESPSGRATMGLGGGHQAVMGTAYGRTKREKGRVSVIDIKTYPPERVQPPEGVSSVDWIKAGMKPGR